MNTTLSLTIKPKKQAGQRKIVVEMDADKLERLAAVFGMLNPDFLEAIERSERDYAAGRVYDVESLEKLRDRTRKK